MVDEVIVDTSALVEYVFGTEKGKRAKEIIESSNNAIIIPSIVLGELASKLERSGIKNVDEIIANISEYSLAIDIRWQTAISAGKKHAQIRKRDDDGISLIDCLVMQIAEEHGWAAILTKDRHFEHYKNTILL